MSTTAAPVPGSSASGRAAQPVAWLLVACILAQAGLSGPAWFQRPSLFELHGWLGSATLLLAAVLVVLTFVARLPVWSRVATPLLVVGSFAQIGLGYAGHRGGLAAASAVHVPLGVALLGLAVAVGVAVRTVSRTEGMEPPSQSR
jgi:hypothetical protein